MGTANIIVLVKINLPKCSCNVQISSLQCANSTVLITNLNKARIRDDLVWLHHIHKWLFESDFTNTTHVEAIHVLPPCEGVVWAWCGCGLGKQRREGNIQCAYIYIVGLGVCMCIIEYVNVGGCGQGEGSCDSQCIFSSLYFLSSIAVT